MISAWIRAAESAPVTAWGPRIALTAVVLAVIGLAIWGMLRGWRAREARQADLPELPAAPAEVLAEPGVAGQYVATTTSGDLLDRIVAHGLGHRGRAELRAGEQGVLIQRIGEVDLWIPRADLRAVRLGSGQAQKAFEAGGVILISWQLGNRMVDTGFRADDPELHITTAEALSALVPTP
ncbi:MAG: hypothetical protein MUF09_01260 [Candidatus Nanopelagicales bacterium]|nr:hypothetical protein [Candidatus Nanopelagicales bacterium]